ncbi:MAG: hypothetical protein AB1816_13760 [Bacillota bacterium]
MTRLVLWVLCVLVWVVILVEQRHPFFSRLSGRCRFTYCLVRGQASCRCDLDGRCGLRCEGGTVWWGNRLYGVMLPDGRVVCTAGPFVVRREEHCWTVACGGELWVVPAPRRRRVGWAVRFLDWWTGCRPQSRPA